MAPPLLAQSPASLAALLRGPGRARMVFRSLASGGDPFNDRALPEGLRARLAEAASPVEAHERARRRAPDGTVKLLLELAGGDAVEAVLIPEPRRTTLCVSSQVGCARGCGFCLTATMGLRRNLAVEEIVAQAHRALAVVQEERLPPLRNLVFMGMGEPLDNWPSVRGALDSLVDGRGFGFGPRHVTVSTVGPSPRAIARLEGCPTRVAWSLHAGRDAVRRALVTTQRHPVEALREAFVELFSKRKDPLFVEMTLIDGVNDGPEDAEAALALLARFPTEVRFNLLPVNPTGRGPQPSPRARVEAFATRLRGAGHFTMIRAARGQEESAACGQLAVLGGGTGSPSSPTRTQSSTPPGG